VMYFQGGALPEAGIRVTVGGAECEAPELTGSEQVTCRLMTPFIAAGMHQVWGLGLGLGFDQSLPVRQSVGSERVE
jgi:hypothetical protein